MDSHLHLMNTDTGTEEDVLTEELVQESEEVEQAKHLNLSSASSTANEDARDESGSIIATTPATTSSHGRMSEVIKYTIVSSSLLSASASEAVPLYASTASSSISQTTPFSSHAEPFRAGSSGAESQTDARLATVKWDSDWQTKGQSWQDRSLALNILVCVTFIANLVFSAFANPSRGKAIEANSTNETNKGSNPNSIQDSSPMTSRPEKEIDPLVNAVKLLIQAAQEIDLGFGNALTQIKELECINWGLGISEPLPPISRIEASGLKNSARNELSKSLPSPRASSPRIPSPLGFSSPFQPMLTATRTEAPPTRAIPVRKTLNRTLESIKSILKTANEQLEQIKAEFALTPDKNLAILRRHEEEAKLDREQQIQRTRQAEEFSLERSANKRQSLGGFSDSSASTASETFFGGVERTLSTSSPSGKTGRGHRIRPSIGTIGIFGLGTAADQTIAASPRRKRPASLGVWPGQTLSGALEQSERFHTHSSPPSPIGKNSPAKIRSNDAPGEISLSALQNSFEEMFEMRKRFLWKFMITIDASADKNFFSKLNEIVQKLSRTFSAGSQQILSAVQAEFGHVAGTTSLARNVPTNFSSGNFSSSRYSQPNFNISSDSRPPNFAPPSQPAQLTALGEFEAGISCMNIALRSITAKCLLVKQDAKRVAHQEIESNELKTEQILSIHDSIKSDLEKVFSEWENTRISLRRSLHADTALDSAAGMQEEVDSTEAETADTCFEPSEETKETEKDFDRSNILFSTIHPGDTELHEPTPDSPPPAKEQIFEAVAGPARTQLRSNLTREERIQLSKQARSRDKENEKPTAVKLEAGMVAELKNVLVLLKGRNHLPADL